MLNKNAWLNSLLQAAWLSACLPEGIRFYKAANSNVNSVQKRTLNEILAGAADSDFARKHQFKQIRSIKDFQQAVPVTDYSYYQQAIERIGNGEPNVLTNDPVNLFELTSGSSSATKLVPYNNSLQTAFNRALHPWLVNLYSSFFGLWGGPAYWVITPKSEQGKRSKGGIPIGFAADSQYFGKWAQHIVELLMAVGQNSSKSKDLESWKYATILALLKCNNLRLISLWNPTFFSQLFYDLPLLAKRLLKDLASQPDISSERFKSIKKAFASFAAGNYDDFTRIIWPDLALISCWTEAEARFGANELRNWFPAVKMQTKGILATESPITIPLVGAPAPVLAVRSAFFEFIEADSSSTKTLLAHELKPGQEYSLLITTFGGFYRYRLGDVVRLKGYWKSLPCFEFVGKEGIVSDLCGEKIHAGHVKAIFRKLGIEQNLAFLAPNRSKNGAKPGYTMFLSKSFTEYETQRLQMALEKELKENFHYKWCLENGQLRPVCVERLNLTAPAMQSKRLEYLQKQGVQTSTAKTGILARPGDWSLWFSGQRGHGR